MITCPDCNAELNAETLAVGSEVECPSCGASVRFDTDSQDLSSIVDQPGDGTLNTGPDSDSSLSGSSYAMSGLADSDLGSEEVASIENPPDLTLEASPRASSLVEEDDLTPPDMDATLVFGGRQDDDDDASFLLGGDEDIDEEDSADFSDLDQVGGESLDATIDIGRLASEDRQTDFDLGGAADDATLDQADRGAAGRPRLDLEGADLESPGQAGEITQMPDGGDLLGGNLPRSKTPSDSSYDATIAADSNETDSDQTNLDPDGSEYASDDSAGEVTESPSSHPSDAFSGRDSATLAFDTERRSDQVGTPIPREITGLESGGTIPRGPLEQGRGSRSLKPGESQIVGSESVRLRAFLLAEPGDDDGTGIDYSIEGEAGQGGMGVVYKARQQSLDRLVAIKQIKSEMGASQSDCDKFVSEAVITGQLEHPNIAPVHDLGLAADGMPFYAMKFVEGQDWEDSIKELSEEENLSILIQVAQAIAFAHSKEVLHRDLKPGNVRLGAFGEVLVMDWGLAARLDDNSNIQPAGTPIYMPPETALEYLDYAKGRVAGGKKKSETSRRRMPAGKYGDIYLLGALLFKIVTRRAPHRGKSTFECLRNAAKNEIVKVRRSSELLDIAYRAMATDPEKRYPTALDFIEAVRSYQSHAQSIRIAKTASRELRAAEQLRQDENADPAEIYAGFSRAQHGYQNALDLWSDNRKAARRRKKALRLFAEAAYDNGDYDLALSMLDTESEDDAELRATVLKDQESRKGRLAWFKTLQYATAASLMLALAFIGYSVYASLDAFSARESLKETIAETTKVTQDADAKVAAARSDVAEAEEVARTKVADAESFAEQAIADATQKAALAIETANKTAAEQVQKANELADQRIAAADAQVVALSSKADLQAYKADIGQVQATLTTNGAYAANQQFVKLQDRLVDKPAVFAYAKSDPTWNYLKTATDWKSEATELVGEQRAVGPTHLATSAIGDWAVTAVSIAKDRVELSIYRSDAEQPERRFTTRGTAAPVAVSANGRYVAVAGATLRVVDTVGQKELTLGGQGGVATTSANITCVAFHPQRPELLVGRTDTGVEQWHIDRGQAQRRVQKTQWHQTTVTAVGYSPDGNQRFSADRSGRIVLWRVTGPGSLDAREVYSHEAVASGSSAITAAKMTNDAAGRLAYGCDDGSVYEIANWWPESSAAGQPISRQDPTLRPPAAKRLEDSGYLDLRPSRMEAVHPQSVTAIDYDGASKLVLSAGGDTLLVQRSVAADKSLAEVKRARRYHDATVLNVAASSGNTAYSSDDKGRVTRWKINVRPREFTLNPGVGQRSGVVAVNFLPKPNEAGAITVADSGGFVRQWDDVSRTTDVDSLYAGHADNRDMQAWHVPGTSPRIVTVAADNRACIWREDDGLLERVIELGGRTIVTVDPDRQLLYAASDGRQLPGESAAMAFPLDGGASTALWKNATRVSILQPLQNVQPGGPTLAVGQRDGQVYLWGPQTGRTDLIRSSGRPHWRPVRTLFHDPAKGRLYSGDSEGLLVEWATDGSTRPVKHRLDQPRGRATPIVRVETASSGHLLVVQRLPSGKALATLVDTTTMPATSTRIERRDLRDATIDPRSGRVIALSRVAGRSEWSVWSKRNDWQASGIEATTDRLIHVEATTAGWLSWGPGIAQWREATDDHRRVAARILSRATPKALVSDDRGESLKAVTKIGSVDQWNTTTGAIRQTRLGKGELVLASCQGTNRDEVLLAISSAGQSTRVERWNLAEDQRVAIVANDLPGVCRTLTTAGDSIAIVFDDRVTTFTSEGDRPTESDLNLNGARPTNVSMTTDGRQLAITTNEGVAILGQRGENEPWSFARLDHQGVTSAAFTPDGTRLIVGVESGRVVLLELAKPEGAVRNSRPLLTFTGHSDRVTLLQVTESGPETKIVSGDASGRVVVRSL